MMAGSLLLFMCCSLGLVFVFIPHVTGLEVRGQTYDLEVQTVSRVLDMEGDDLKFVVTVDFTASIPPQIQWTHAGPIGETVFLNDTQMTFSNGRGQGRVIFGVDIRLVTLRIGYLDTHVLNIFIKEDYPFDATQTLNARLSTVSPGYDIVYSPGESFQVTAFIPEHIADNFNWVERGVDPDDKYYDVRLDACYVNQSSGLIVSSVDNLVHDPDMTRFLQSTKTFGADGARWTLDFTTAAEDISGYFRLFTLSDHKDYRNEDVDQFVIGIWERIDIKVHNASTPGPFPDKYALVKSSDFDFCEDEEQCSIYCYGYANNITEVAIFKEDTGESPGRIYTSYENSNTVFFYSRFFATGNFAGNYVCRIVAADGTTAQSVVELYAD